ncbi:hypothetical protein DFH06DRAFT_1168858 [Mycena polygramma]|nr:hypothetical protein DFH06DRAFT_1168858 [Mycena polygramma]
MPAKFGELCENCFVSHQDLRRCAACGLTRYCSRECQRAHWKKHKPDCGENVEARNVAKVLGPEYVVRLPALQKWSEDFGMHIGAAAGSALDILKHRERIASTIVVFYLDFLGPSAKAPYTHDVVNAEVVSLEDLTRKHCIVPHLLAEFLHLHAPRPDRHRIILLDVRFPWPYPLNFVVPPQAIFDQLALNRVRLEPRWFEELQRKTTRPGRLLRPRETIQIDVFVASVEVWRKSGKL